MGQLSPSPTSARPPEDRLDSWKEIASYLNRDVTTVQRWEKREGMPVHRHLHDSVGSVYASRAELDAWARSRKPPAPPPNGHNGSSPNALAPPPDSAISTPSTGWTFVLAEARRHKSVLAAAVLAILAIALAAGFGLDKLAGRSRRTIDTRNITVRPFTENGQAIDFASISADGKLIAYGQREGERSLRVKQVATGSEVTVVPPQPGFFVFGATFTPDGNYLYYTHADPSNPNDINLYSVPSLGGPSRQIVADVASAVSFSADGKRMVYTRTFQGKGEDQVLIANADGTGEKVIFRLGWADRGPLASNPSWAASSDLIAVSACEAGKNEIASILVLTPDGKLVKRFPLPMLVWAVAWLPDSSGMFFEGAEKSTGLRKQIWFKPYPAGEPFKVTNDLSQYTEISVSPDGKSFVTTQERQSATIYVADSPSVLSDKVDWKLTPISTGQATGYGLSWTAASRLLQRDAASHVYATDADGSNRVRLMESDDLLFDPNACGSGNMVVIGRLLENNSPNLWRLNAASGELKQLTFGKDEETSSCTPDGKWVLYGGLKPNGVPGIFKISIEGGEPVELASGSQSTPAVSPDGKLIAYQLTDGQGASAKSKIVVQRLESGAVIKVIEIAWTLDWQELGWSPDGRALTYVHDTTGSSQNLYMQPLDGGAPVQLTHFDSEPAMLRAYAWSRDGKKLALTRARYNDSDVVMFSGFR